MKLCHYTLSDGLGTTSSATVDVIVHGANDAPIAVDDTIIADEHDGWLVIDRDLLNNDYDEDEQDVLTVVNIGASTTQGGSSSG